MKEPDFLSAEDVLLLHGEQLARYGGGAGVRDAGSFESAVATPQASFGGEFVHPDLFAQAAAYAFHVAQNQSLVDGNKRAGLAAALVFLDINGVEIADPEGKLYTAMIDIAERRLDKSGLATLLQDLKVPSTSDVIAAHAHTIRHRAELEKSSLVGCFACLRTYDQSLIREWTDNQQTALCPFCGIDSVIGAASGFPIEANFLRRMQLHWFRVSRL
jgi:death-on-curing protein